MASSDLLHSPLDSEHQALGARMAEFGGWEMPIQYSGVLEEHRSCRTDAVVFDVSHLGSLRVFGPAAKRVLQQTFTNDLERIGPSKAQYTHLLDSDDGHVVDDVIIWWVDDDEFLVMPNASNTNQLIASLSPVDGCEVQDITSTRAVLAVQGPAAATRLKGMFVDNEYPTKFTVVPFSFSGHEGFAAGTGYTGEDGLELHVPLAAVHDLWQSLLAAGVTPAGLGARDTLRLEAGLPLHGFELGPGITPLQAGLGWVVRPEKGEFLGRTPYLAELASGPERRLRGLMINGRQIPRHGCPINLAGSTVGEVTSGNFSPMLNCGIALGFLPPEIVDGSPVEIGIRDRFVEATVVKPPFVSSKSI